MKPRAVHNARRHLLNPASRSRIDTVYPPIRGARAARDAAVARARENFNPASPSQPDTVYPPIRGVSPGRHLRLRERLAGFTFSLGVLLVTWSLSVAPPATAAAPPSPLVTSSPSSSPPSSSPVLLVPGFMGWREMDPMGAYFGGLRDALREAGADVYAVAPPPIASSEARGVFVMRAIDDVLRRTHAKKVAIIAHSQGGLDVRVALAHGYGDKIAVITTLSTPHEGTDLADAALAWFPHPVVQAALERVQATWEYEQHVPHVDADAAGALSSLSRKGVAKFNKTHKDSSGVPFFSIAAVTGDDVDKSCTTGGKWGAPDKTDWLDPLFGAAHLMIRLKGGDESDDGVVPTNSMRFGTYLGCVAADHADWMGWSLHKDDELAFLVELWKGMRDVDALGDSRAMDAHVPALAKLAHAKVVDDTAFASR